MVKKGKLSVEAIGYDILTCVEPMTIPLVLVVFILLFHITSERAKYSLILLYYIQTSGQTAIDNCDPIFNICMYKKKITPLGLPMYLVSRKEDKGQGLNLMIAIRFLHSAKS